MNRNRKVKKKVDFIFMHRGLLSFLQDNESGHFMPLFNRAIGSYMNQNENHKINKYANCSVSFRLALH